MLLHSRFRLHLYYTTLFPNVKRGQSGGAHTSRPRADSVWSHAQFPHFEPLIVYRVSYSRCGVGYIVNHTLKWGIFYSYICHGGRLSNFYRSSCVRSQFPSLWGCFEYHMRGLGGESKKISKTCSLRPLAHIDLNVIYLPSSLSRYIPSPTP